jgi:protein AbiQ
VQYILLSQKFCTEFPFSTYTELEQKECRPYILLLVKVRGLDFAIPLRSHIKHRYAFFTNRVKGCGADYSKAVVITDKAYIDTKRPYVRPEERKELFGKAYRIRQEFEAYIRQYEKAVKNQNAKHNQIFCQCSTLQYFHNELNIKN